MKKNAFFYFHALLWLLGLAMSSNALAASPHLIEVEGPIGPPVAHYIERTLSQAAAEHVPFVVMRLDTPGGLMDSMRDINQAILAAPLPVVCWVGPKGARAASAGTYMLYACDLAAMASGTNIGAATPVQMTGLGESDTPAKAETAEEKKVLNDAVAYIRSMAELHQRNADWAEEAVRHGASLSTAKALEKNVIDLVADDLPELLAKLDGRTVSIGSQEITFDTQGVALATQEQSWKEQVLSVLASPSIAYLLLMIGIYGLILEGLNPGAFLPGTLGAICLIVALFALQLLPVSWAGFGLIVLGTVLLVAEGFVPSFGTLGLGGLIAFVLGSVMLFDADAPGYALPAVYIGSASVVAALGLGVIVYFITKMRHQPVVTGDPYMVGITVIALENFEEQGYVLALGERWLARTTHPVKKDDKLVTDRIESLTLFAHPLNPEEK